MQEYLEFWKRYVDLNARTNRRGFWMWFLVNLVVSFVIGLAAVFSGLEILSSIYSLAIFVPTLAIIVRRLRDAGKNPVWVVATIIPIVGLITLYFCCLNTDYNSAYVK